MLQRIASKPSSATCINSRQAKPRQAAIPHADRREILFGIVSTVILTAVAPALADTSELPQGTCSDTSVRAVNAGPAEVAFLCACCSVPMSLLAACCLSKLVRCSELLACAVSIGCEADGTWPDGHWLVPWWPFWLPDDDAQQVLVATQMHCPLVSAQACAVLLCCPVPLPQRNVLHILNVLAQNRACSTQVADSLHCAL